MLGAARGVLPGRRILRIGVTGLARAGKTALLTSIGANLLAAGAGVASLPALSAALGGRALRARRAAPGAERLPRFDHQAHLEALARDPPAFPARTGAVSLLAIELDIGRARRLRLEFLDYPGEWLLDLPLLGQDFSLWAQGVLRRLEGEARAAAFLAFVHGLPAGAGAEETLARAGATLYRDLLRRLRDEAGLCFLQPGRLLMPAPGPPPPWVDLFPMAGAGGLARLMRARFDAYCRQVAADLVAPGLGRIDRMVVLADLLSALHAGPAAFADMQAALAAVGSALHRRTRPGFLPPALARLLPWGGIRRVAFAASKADHVAQGQRDNLAALMGALTPGPAPATALALAAVRCAEDFVWTLEGRPVSAVRGRVEGQGLVGSYPGEIPRDLPEAAFWRHRFLAVPDFQPMRLPLGGRGGVAHIGVDRLLAFLLEDVL
ncbi:MAG: YcjX family protein [Rhodospirillales bacterium]|nr:YcjX family protein [Rhodospirillales bacterium]